MPPLLIVVCQLWIGLRLLCSENCLLAMVFGIAPIYYARFYATPQSISYATNNAQFNTYIFL